MDPVTEPVPSLYQVFISHRGPDTKNNLASLIYHRLKRDRLHVFLDKHEIPLGVRISSAIVSAIQSASVHIAIMSPGYADSVWCLDELSQMMESSKNHESAIIAVFYDVEAADLRHIESKCYAEAFKKHERERRYEIKDVQRWKKALKEAAEIKGETYKRKESDRGKHLEVINEGEVIDKIVKWVWNWVKFWPSEVASQVGLDQAADDSHEVGLKKAAEDFENTIMYTRESQSTKIVTIAGNQSAGKSTLAKYLFDRFREDFPKCCLLDIVRDGDFLSLQQQLIDDLLTVGHYQIRTSREGKDVLRQFLRKLKVLIVLDQVDHMDQIDSLLDMNEVGCGSLILITSRDKDLLEVDGEHKFLYEVKPLNREHARQLFCYHAFHRRDPFPGSEVFVDGILNMCSGWPFALEVWGKHVREAGLDRDNMGGREYWERQLGRFRNELPPRRSQQLRPIYESLGDIQKCMFLDICCFLLGEDKDLAVSVLEGLHSDYKYVWDYVKSLCNKSLIGIDDYDLRTDHEIGSGTELDYEDLCLPPPRRSYKIIVRDELRLLARDLAQEEFRALRPLRLSCVNDLDTMFRSGVDVDSSIKIRGIRISEQFDLREAHVRGKGVCLFVLEGPIQLSSFFGLWDVRGELVWLRLRNFDSKYFPSAMTFSRLRVLELQCHGDYLEQLFQRFDKPALSLSELTIHVKDRTVQSMSRSSLLGGSGTPYFCSFLQWIGVHMKRLQKIVLKNIKSLKELPINFGELNLLTHLDLSGCTNLTRLPSSSFKVQQLQYLALRQCSKLIFLDNFLGETSTLEYADFKGCLKLRHFPTCLVSSQRSLRYLNLLSTNLFQFPEMLELRNLERLRIGSPLLPNLPSYLCNLGSLEELVLIKCRNLIRISQEGIAWPNIKVLAIESCPIAEFSFHDRETVNVSMPVLRDFTLKDTSISQICITETVAPRLETADLSGNARLTQVNGLPSALVTLNLEGCSSLKTLTNLSNLVNLKSLNINRCVTLETLDVNGLTLLEEIKAEACLKLHSIEQLSDLQRLNSLRISTDNIVFWRDIFQFLVSSPSYISTVFLSGKTENYMVAHESVMESILENFEGTLLRPVHEFPVRLNNIRPNGAILMCFITSGLIGTAIRISERSNSCRQYDVHNNPWEDGSGGRRLHVLMCTENSALEVEFYDNGNMDAGPIEKSWMVELDSKTKVLDLCRLVIFAFGPY